MTMNDRALARRVEDELRAQGLQRVLVDPQVLRQLAGLLQPRSRTSPGRDAAEHALAGMELRWSRTEGRSHEGAFGP